MAKLKRRHLCHWGEFRGALECAVSRRVWRFIPPHTHPLKPVWGTQWNPCVVPVPPKCSPWSSKGTLLVRSDSFLSTPLFSQQLFTWWQISSAERAEGYQHFKAPISDSDVQYITVLLYTKENYSEVKKFFFSVLSRWSTALDELLD